MCLSTLDKVKSCENGIAYKVVHIPPGSNTWMPVVYDNHSRFSMDIPNIDNKNIMLECEGESKQYRCGFHLFTNLEDARKWQWKDSVMEVAFEDVTVTGTQECDSQDDCCKCFIVPVIVARKIQVLRVLE